MKMINCKRCGDRSDVVKNGKVRNQQRYYCKSCAYNFVRADKRQNRGYPEEVKALAVMLYGTMKCSYGMIARLLKTSRRTVYMWVKQAGNELPEPALPEKIEAIEFDEMWHFVQSKKNKWWIWKALDPSSRKCIAWVIGRRDAQTFRRLYDKATYEK